MSKQEKFCVVISVLTCAVSVFSLALSIYVTSLS